MTRPKHTTDKNGKHLFLSITTFVIVILVFYFVSRTMTERYDDDHYSCHDFDTNESACKDHSGCKWKYSFMRARKICMDK